MVCREHPELSEGLCVEMMTRQLADSGAHTLQHQVLTALAPWMENLSFRPRWEGSPHAFHLPGSHSPGASEADAQSPQGVKPAGSGAARIDE